MILARRHGLKSSSLVTRTLSYFAPISRMRAVSALP